MAKSLVIYYSFDGNTKFLAEVIAKSIGADLLQIKPRKDISNKGFMKYIWGGRQVLFGERPELESFDINIEDYQNIILGTPVRAFSFAPAFNTLFDQVKISGKNVALFACYEGSLGRTFDNIKKRIPDNKFLGEFVIFAPLKRDKGNAEASVKKRIYDIGL